MALAPLFSEFQNTQLDGSKTSDEIVPRWNHQLMQYSCWYFVRNYAMNFSLKKKQKVSG